jgi:uncharacterized protein YcbK (DUF882 family)
LTLSLAATASLAAPKFARARSGERRIAFYNIHTSETLDTVYWAEGAYVTEGLGAVDRVLRDFRSGEVQAIDPELIDLLHRLHERLGGREAFQVISGYRSPTTNAMLRKQSGGVAKRSRIGAAAQGGPVAQRRRGRLLPEAGLRAPGHRPRAALVSHGPPRARG